MFTDEVRSFDFIDPNLLHARNGNQTDFISYEKNRQLNSHSIAVFDPIAFSRSSPFPLLPNASIEFDNSKELGSNFDSFVSSDSQGTHFK